MRTTTLALLVLSVIAVGALAPVATAATQCQWNDREGGVVDTVQDASGGHIHFHSGEICTVHVHP